MSSKRRFFRFGPESGMGTFPCWLVSCEDGSVVKARVMNLSVMGVGFEITDDPGGAVRFGTTFVVKVPKGGPGYARLLAGKTVNVMRVRGLVAGVALEKPLAGGDEDLLGKRIGSAGNGKPGRQSPGSRGA